jgi:lysophospholipase L1-like esterase
MRPPPTVGWKARFASLHDDGPPVSLRARMPARGSDRGIAPAVSRARVGTLLLAAASLAVTLGLAELAFRAAGYTALHDRYSSPELFWRHDPILGWALEANARGRFVGPRPFPVEFDTTIETNSLGLRGPELSAPAPGERRVLFLGDSFVAGFEVEQEETFTALLEKRLDRRLGEPFRVINAAVRGYGTDQSYLWFRDRGRALDAELVVAVFSANDFEDNVTLHRPRRPFGKPAFALLPTGALELRGSPVPRYAPCSSWVLGADYMPRRADGGLSRAACFLQMRLADHSALFSWVATSLARLPGVVHFLNRFVQPERSPALPETAKRRRHVAGVGAPTPEERARIESELTTALLQALAREVRAAGARFLLLMVPRHWPRIDLRALRADQIPIESVTIPEGVDPRSIRFENDGHLNAHGHRFYADGLLPIVESALREPGRSGTSAKGS